MTAERSPERDSDSSPTTSLGKRVRTSSMDSSTSDARPARRDRTGEADNAGPSYSGGQKYEFQFEIDEELESSKADAYRNQHQSQ